MARRPAATPRRAGDLADAWWSELIKARRSKLPWITALAFTVAPAVGGLFMFILQDPERARSLGLIGAKAQLTAGRADWPSYLDLLTQITAVGGLLVFGLVAAWLFGREFSDHTVRDLLAVPTSRESIVAAKFGLETLWCLLLGLQTYLLGIAIGSAVRLPGWSTDAALDGLLHLLTTTILTILLTWPFALAASVGRGYLVAVGCMLAAVFVAQVVAALGYGQYLPWAIPALYSGVAGTTSPPIGLPSIALVAATGITAALATATWWRRADQTS